MPEPRYASPAARDLAGEMDVDAGAIEGSGRNGTVTVADVRAAGSKASDDPGAEPSGLGAAGRALWASIVGDLPDGFELDARELDLLERAARQADDVARCEAVIERDGVEALGSAGQPVVSPHLLEARQGRQAIARLLGAIELPDEDEKPRSEASRRGKRAAAARWGRRDEIADRRAAGGA